MATGSGPKGQEGGAIPGGEVAGRRLAQALVGNLNCEESQPLRLVGNWSEPDVGERPLSSWGHAIPPSSSPAPPLAQSSPSNHIHQPLHWGPTCRPGIGKACLGRWVRSPAIAGGSPAGASATRRPLGPSPRLPTSQESRREGQETDLPDKQLRHPRPHLSHLPSPCHQAPGPDPQSLLRGL